MTITDSFKNIIRLFTPPIFGVLKKKLMSQNKYQKYQPFDCIYVNPEKISTLFDIGANQGDVSIKAYKAFPNAKIYSFEPVSTTFATLEKNTRQYRDRILLSQLGFFTESKKIPIHITSFDGANSIIDQSRDHKKVHSHLDLKEIGEEIIEVRTLDSFVESHQIDKIDIMKIDVEGVEKEVLLGGIETLKKKVDIILIELSFLRKNRESPYWIEICQLLYNLGFELITIYDVAKYVEDGQEYIAQMDAVFRKQGKKFSLENI